MPSQTMLDSEVATFWTPKRGCEESEYEDAFAMDVSRRCFALADGATESSFAKKWADLLASGFVNDAPKALSLDGSEMKGWLASCRQRWHRFVPWEQLKGMKKVKAAHGACSTLLGLWFVEEASVLKWHAWAVGDTCLFFVRNGTLTSSFPVTNSQAFGSSPNLLTSVPSLVRADMGLETVRAGEVESGDLFILATDALSDWFLREVEAEGKPWERFCAMSGAQEFADCIETLRDSGTLRNDDTTAMLVRFGNGADKKRGDSVG
jgi:hypothetical protein